MNYTKLTQDLKDATEAAVKVAAETEDAGTCNLDGPILYVEGEPRLMAAIERAGLRGWEGSQFGSPVVHVVLPVGGQGFSRTKAAEAFSNLLNERGHKAGVWYQID